MTKIFMSYRRADSRPVTERMYDYLAERFEFVFRDLDAMRGGLDFRDQLDGAIKSCQIVLVVIGPQWLRRQGIRHLFRRRIDHPQDYVRQEIEAALDRLKRVIPVLVLGATMPGEGELPRSLQRLAYLQAVVVRPEPDFVPDMERLVREIKRLSPGPRPESRELEEGAPRPGPDATQAERRSTAKPQLAYRQGGSPFFHAEGPSIIADSTGERAIFRGVNMSGLERTNREHNPYPGVVGRDYLIPCGPAQLQHVRELGLNHIRLPFQWARLVSGWHPGDPLPTSLEAGYVALLDDIIAQAARQGLYVVLDLHDHLAYRPGPATSVSVNDSQPHQQLLAQTWRMLAAHYAGNPAVLGYDLMHEPPRVPAGASRWHALAQEVVQAVREVDQEHLIFVEGAGFSVASSWLIDNLEPFIVDPVVPARVVYSPHACFDYENVGTYHSEGEAHGPARHWEQYVRERLEPAVTWSRERQVPLYFGEVVVPSVPGWAEVLDYVFRHVFHPLDLSTAIWLVGSGPPPATDGLTAGGHAALSRVLSSYPGRPFLDLSPTVADADRRGTKSEIFADGLVNPWHQSGSWGDVRVDLQNREPVRGGTYSIAVEYGGTWGGLRFSHAFGLDVRCFDRLAFWIFPLSASLDFKIFTNGPLPECREHPTEFRERRNLSDYVRLVSARWQLVEVPLPDIVSRDSPIVTAICFQDTGKPQAVFYLDQVCLLRRG